MLPFKGIEASAYNNSNLSGATVIDIYNETTQKFTEKSLDNLAIAAGYTDIIDMTEKATATGTPLAEKLSGKVVQFGKDNNDGGSELKWAPVYLSRSTDGDPILTLWLATDVYNSTWSDGTYSTSTKKIFNGTEIYSNTYDGSFIRHQLSGKTGWTTTWGTGSNQNSANAKIGAMVSDFYGSGSLAKYVVTPSKVGWQTGSGSGRLKNDPGWAGNASSANYPCDWINDNVWLPSVYEVSDSTLTADSTKSSFIADGGLWGVNVGEICDVNHSYSWLRSALSSNYAHSHFLDSNSGAFSSVPSLVNGVRPAIHLNLKSAAAEVEHRHTFGEWEITKPATCTTVGERARTCSVDGCPLPSGKQTEEIPVDPTAHNYAEEFTVDTPATCTTAGSQSRHCKNCDDKIEVTVIPMLDHDWGEWITITAGSCTSSGQEKRICSRCSETEEHTITASGHKYTETVVAPTCTEDGYTKHTCSVCGDSYDDTPTDATGHTYGEPAWVWGTNYLTATAKFSCSVCHSERTLNASVTHDSTTASCTVAGDVTHTATVNLDGTPYTEVKVAKGEKLPHDSEIVSVTVEPTCTQDGAGQMKCKNCGEEYTDIIPALGHDFADEFTVDKEPTCTEDGSKSKHCSRCDEKDEVTAIPALGHSFELIGWTWNEDYTASVDFECSVCKEHASPTVTVTYDEQTKTYTASVELDGKQYTDEKAETVTPPVIDPPDKPDNPDDPNGDGKKDGFPWWIILIAAAVLLFFIILIIIIVKRRNSKDEDYYDDEYYDDEDEEDEDEEEDYDDEDY